MEIRTGQFFLEELHWRILLRNQAKEKHHPNMWESCHILSMSFSHLTGAGSESVLPGMGLEGLELGENCLRKTKAGKLGRANNQLPLGGWVVRTQLSGNKYQLGTWRLSEPEFKDGQREQEQGRTKQRQHRMIARKEPSSLSKQTICQRLSCAMKLQDQLSHRT